MMLMRSRESLALLPSVAVLKDGVPIAWGFIGESVLLSLDYDSQYIGADGSLKTLHCEVSAILAI
jgi:hypothetical protein